MRLKNRKIFCCDSGASLLFINFDVIIEFINYPKETFCENSDNHSNLDAILGSFNQCYLSPNLLFVRI